MSRLVLTVPMPQPASNRRLGNGWRTIYREKIAYQKGLDQLLAAGLLPDPPATPLAKATLHSVMYLGNHMDDDNAMARHKVVVDWMRTRGYLVDDRRKCLTWAGLPEQVVKRGQPYRIVLTLEAA